MKRSSRDVLIIGFALFAVFFGAGNLVFPPTIGMMAGQDWIPAVAGLTLTGIALPILAVVAVGKAEGDFEAMTKPVAPWFFNVFWYFATFLAACITVPRIGGVANEVGFGGIIGGGTNKVMTFLFLIAFFAVVYYFTCDKSNIVDKIGKILTPVLLIILLIIIISGFVKPIGAPAESSDNAFSMAFLEAYNIGDMVTGLLCASIFIASIKDKGYGNHKETFSMTVKAAVIAFLGLFVVYGGLCFIGASANGTLSAELDQTSLLVAAVELLMGRPGLVAFSLCTIVACLSTAIGIVAVVADFINIRTKGKVPFKVAVLAICILDVLLASGGVAFLINMAAPIFLLLYPVSIVLVLNTLAKDYIPNDGAIKGSVLMAGLIAIHDAIAALNGNGWINIPISWMDGVYNAIPLSQYGFAWIIPSIIGFIVGALIFRAVKGRVREPKAENGESQ